MTWNGNDLGKAALLRSSFGDRLGWALVATFLLVLQTFAAASVPAASAAPRDAFGNPLCTTSGNHAAPVLPEGDALAGCCTLACATAAAGVEPAEPVVLAAPLAVSQADIVPTAAVAVACPPRHSLANPRAPPFC